MSMSVPPRLPPGERLRRAGIAAWSIIGILILLGASAWLLIKIRVIFPPLVLALLIIYLVDPIVTRLERRRVKRPLAAVFSYVIVLGSLTLLIMAAAPFVSSQVTAFARNWPEFRTDLIDFARDTSEAVEDRTGLTISTARVECLLGAADQEAPSEARCDRLTETLREQIVAQAGRISEITFGVLETLLAFVLAPLIALYLLIDLPQLKRDLLNLVPEAYRDEAADVGAKVGRAVGGFFRGQLFVALLVGLLSALGFRLIGLPFWFLIGAVAGFFNLIPLVGPFIGGALGFLVGVVYEGVGLGLQAALVELVVQQLDNHFISPNVMSRTVKLHPATVILSLLAGGAIAGFWGVLLGVPAVAVIKLLAGHFWSTRVLGREVSPAAPAEPPTRAPPPASPEEPEPPARAEPAERAEATERAEPAATRSDTS